jgi:glycosyltransferase involved in cell wall biosynthesis
MIFIERVTMNICILSKFPPIEGGISAKTYWLSRGYAAAGMSVHIISNGNTVETDYRVRECDPSKTSVKGMIVHEVEESLPWHIPEDSHALTKLIEKTLEVNQLYPLDVIDTGYLIPYGIAGYIVNKITGIPYVVRHGGSDLEKFLKPGIFKNLLEQVLKNASAIITDSIHESFFSTYKEKLEFIAPYVPDSSVFSPVLKKINSFPFLLYLGKINWHWQKKGLDMIAGCIPFLPKGWELSIIGQGRGLGPFKQFSRQSGFDEAQIQPFVSLLQVPLSLQKADYVFCLSVDEPIKTISNTLLEAIQCGTTVIVNETFDSSQYEGIVNNIDNFILRIPSCKPQEIVQSIAEHWKSREFRKTNSSIMVYSYEDYIEMNLEILERARTSGYCCSH